MYVRIYLFIYLFICHKILIEQAITLGLGKLGQMYNQIRCNLGLQ